MSSTLKSRKAELGLSWQLCLVFVLGAAAIMLPDMVYAGYGNALEEVLCKAVGLMTGPTGKALATIAITIIGIGALLGKVSWGIALIVAVGVALVFGAGTIITAVTPTSTVSGAFTGECGA